MLVNAFIHARIRQIFLSAYYRAHCLEEIKNGKDESVICKTCILTSPHRPS